MIDQDIRTRAYELALDAQIKFAGAYGLANAVKHIVLRLVNSHRINRFEEVKLIYLLDLMEHVFSDNYDYFSNEIDRLTTNSDMQGDKQ